MLNRFVLLTSLVVITFPICTQAKAGNGSRDFVLLNTSDYAIIELYVSPSDSATWSENKLGRSIVNQDGTFFVDLDNRGRQCEFDIKVVFENGVSDVATMDLCSTDILEISE